MTNNFLINYEPNTSIKLSKSKLNKHKNRFYNINLKKIKFNNEKNSTIKKTIFNKSKSSKFKRFS